ncbi:MAG TPA: 16S rRNA (cytidine(1402)-2'-O)-methyltransferase [Candidatus Bathyarchaeia archaeon]|nr:16S rRNA (cytidine(1402)-2'-O)-methyltransferase [Candidatus Bathyarchaeia archaeon]
MKPYPFYLVSTPIGNLGDLSTRAAETLRSVDFILAEDTRTVRVLLDRYGIRVPVRSYHDHNKETVAPAVVREIKGGARFALVADAGTPMISDPGYYLVRKLIEEGVAFTAVPGASACITALVLSGLPTDRFTFFGYVPRKAGERGKVLREAAENPYTSVFYESPHRLMKTLEAAVEILGEREMVAARELTKVHEEVLRGTAAELAGHFAKTAPRGEFTLLVRGLGKRRSRE